MKEKHEDGSKVRKSEESKKMKERLNEGNEGKVKENQRMDVDETMYG